MMKLVKAVVNNKPFAFSLYFFVTLASLDNSGNLPFTTLRVPSKHSKNPVHEHPEVSAMTVNPVFKSEVSSFLIRYIHFNLFCEGIKQSGCSRKS